MKIIFLDHYGVMTLSSIITDRGKNDFPSIEEINLTRPLDSFNSHCVDNLNDIIAKTNCDIVIISDWIKYVSFDTICEFYLNQGVVKKPISHIEVGKNIRKSRKIGIEKWIMENKIQKYVCVDDIYLDVDNFVWCKNPSTGLDIDIKNKVLILLS